MRRTIMAVAVAATLAGAPAPANAAPFQSDTVAPAQVVESEAVATETPAVQAPPVVEAPAKPRKASFLERLSTVVAAATAGMAAIRQAGTQIKAGGAADGTVAPATAPQ